MAVALRRSDKTLVSGVGPADCPPGGDLILDPQIPAGAELPWVVIEEGDVIRAMTDEERAAASPESMTERHAREQREGVTLSNGWVMRWGLNDQLQMNLAKSRADLLERDDDTSPGVPFFEANGTPHLVTYLEAYEVLLDYSSKVMVEQMRQWTEAING